jgi:hypothetical protein
MARQVVLENFRIPVVDWMAAVQGDLQGQRVGFFTELASPIFDVAYESE